MTNFVTFLRTSKRCRTIQKALVCPRLCFAKKRLRGQKLFQTSPFALLVQRSLIDIYNRIIYQGNIFLCFNLWNRFIQLKIKFFWHSLFIGPTFRNFNYIFDRCTPVTLNKINRWLLQTNPFTRCRANRSVDGRKLILS